MKRHNNPIEIYPLKGSVDTGISYNICFVEYQACVAAGLDYYEWEYGTKYTNAFKAHVIAGYRLNEYVEMHTRSAVDEAMSKKIKKRRHGKRK